MFFYVLTFLSIVHHSFGAELINYQAVEAPQLWIKEKMSVSGVSGGLRLEIMFVARFYFFVGLLIRNNKNCRSFHGFKL
jgi:hypothetical protein